MDQFVQDPDVFEDGVDCLVIRLQYPCNLFQAGLRPSAHSGNGLKDWILARLRMLACVFEAGLFAGFFPARRSRLQICASRRRIE
ncbi:MAG: hypothetical protein JWP38_2435 [Herbaspirillum sp.]|nr:hypothetical protein [Herbaspirillum sp.]